MTSTGTISSGKPSGAQEAYNTALLLREGGQQEQARLLLEESLAREPGHFESLRLLGLVYADLDLLQQAVEWISRAIELSPHSAKAHLDLGTVMCRLGQLSAGLECFDQAVRLDPAAVEPLFLRGNTWFELKQWQQAATNFAAAVMLQPGFVQAHNNLGLAWCHLGEFGSALETFAVAIALEPERAELYSNQGVAYYGLSDYAQAVACYEQAITLAPGDAVAHSNLGNALVRQLRLPAALLSYSQAVALAPDNADAQWNRSLALLQTGDFRQGWALHEWRWKRPAFKAVKRSFSQPLWLGDTDLAGRTLLLHSEQGLGDTIQFCRFAGLAAARGARVLLEVEPALAALLANLEGVAQIVLKGAELPAFDCHCPLLSLPLAFKTELDSVPYANRYLTVDRAKLKFWEDKLGKKMKPRVGLVWSGDIAHRDDRRRSIQLAELLAYLPDCFAYPSLQKEVRETDRAALESRPEIMHFGSQLTDFCDTAALCELMDVVISVDTSVAHLSGALGRPTKLLLPFCPDWRWLLLRGDSPWYNSFQLYRQLFDGQWGTAISPLVRRLRSDLAC